MKININDAFNYYSEYLNILFREYQKSYQNNIQSLTEVIDRVNNIFFDYDLAYSLITEKVFLWAVICACLKNNINSGISILKYAIDKVLN